MQNLPKLFISLVLIFGLFNCKGNDKRHYKPQSQTKKSTQSSTQHKKEILIQPFADFPLQRAEYIHQKVKQIWQNTKLLRAIDLPFLAFYKPRGRYRADSLIDWLRNRISGNQVVAGLTSRDISTTKLPNPDSGVMGLGFLNGPACVVSTFRLKKGSNEQLLKTVMHELGHNFGLDHCPELTCLMRDAKGRNPIDEEKEFCPNCKNKLLNAGWVL